LKLSLQLPSSLQINSTILPWSRPRPLPFASFKICDLEIILPF
jgi:hypothetical protein